MDVMFENNGELGHFLVYAFNADGKLVHISEVEKGKACGCRCPACNELLIARKGEIRVNHFAHVSGTECKYGLQTSIHYLAKEIIEESKSLWLPSVAYTHIDERGNPHPDTVISRGGLFDVDKVELEKKYGEYIPDILLYKNNRKLIVEIYVTHKVDKKKLDKIKESKTSAIEIDLSNAIRQIDKETLRRIINSGRYTYWLYNQIQEQKNTAEETAYANYKKNLIQKHGNNKRYYKIYSTKYGEDIIFNPPCHTRVYYKHKRVRYVYACSGCPYFLEVERPKTLEGDWRLWCQRKDCQAE